MWQRFTERARRVILLGQEEATKMESGHVGTEHLLLGLVRESEGVAAQVLQKMGVSLQRVRQEIEAEVQPMGEATGAEPKLTPKAKRVLELAADEARRMRHNYIGTEHLLLALLREKDGVAAGVLRKLGLNLEKVRMQVLEYLGTGELSKEKARPESSRQYSIEQWQLVGDLIETVQTAVDALSSTGKGKKDKLEAVNQKLEELKNRHRGNDAGDSSEH